MNFLTTGVQVKATAAFFADTLPHVVSSLPRSCAFPLSRPLDSIFLDLPISLTELYCLQIYALANNLSVVSQLKLLELETDILIYKANSAFFIENRRGLL